MCILNCAIQEAGMIAPWVFWIKQYLKLDGTMGILSYAVLKLRIMAPTLYRT
jgi:hypothetical protein